jgi:hypothetical protein
MTLCLVADRMAEQQHEYEQMMRDIQRAYVDFLDDSDEQGIYDRLVRFVNLFNKLHSIPVCTAERIVHQRHGVLQSCKQTLMKINSIKNLNYSLLK